MSTTRHATKLVGAVRATRFPPNITAQAFHWRYRNCFWETAASACANLPSPTVSIIVIAHSIAVSTLYFGIIPAVILAFVNGVSHTGHTIPRILGRLKADLDRVFASKKKITQRSYS